MSLVKHEKIVSARGKGFLLVFLLTCSIAALSQGDIANTHPPGLWENKVSLIRIKTTSFDTSSKREIVYTSFKVILRPDKEAPKVKLKDSTEFISRYLIFNAKGQLICDSDAAGDYSQHFKYNSEGRIIENLRTGGLVDTIIWERKLDSVQCFQYSAIHRRRPYFILKENGKAQPLKLYVRNLEKKWVPYSDYLYNATGLLTDEIYYHVVTGKIAMQYKYESAKSGLFKLVSYTSPHEPSYKSEYEYIYYK